MAKSSLLGAERAAPEPLGRDTAALGPSDSSDSGSDMVGLDNADGSDPTLPVDVALRDDAPHPLLSRETLGGLGSDAAGTGERRSAGGDAGGHEAADIGVDRVFVPGRRSPDGDPPDDEDPDLDFIDELQAEDLADAQDEALDEEQDDAARDAVVPPPLPPHPNPQPDEPEGPDADDPEGEDIDALGRPIPALLRRRR